MKTKAEQFTNTESTKTENKQHQSKAAHISLWVVQVLLAVMFVMAGMSKVAGAAEMVALFEDVGLGQWFRYLTGILEVAAAVMIVIPSIAASGALLLAAVMAGAVLSHLFVIGGSAFMPGIYLILALIVAWGRRVP